MTINNIKDIEYLFIPIESKLPLASDLDVLKNKLYLKGKTKLLIGITVYNESSTALIYSLASLRENLDYLIQQKKILPEAVTLCLIFDGRDKISPSVLELLENLELYNYQALEQSSGAHIFVSQLDFDHIEKLISVNTLEKHDNHWLQVYQTAQSENKLLPKNHHQPRLKSIEVILCIKEQNLGKLNSHWWFFQVLGTYLQPKYCVQMDVGSIPCSSNLGYLWEFLEQNPDVGAAAGGILVPEPKQLWNLISVWQFGYFCLEKLLSSPTEIIAGYLSILPGQFSILRWQSLISSHTKNYHPGKTVANSALDFYFQGLTESTTFKSNMFLTEDRILGFNIVTSGEGDWRLAYLPSVVTITDECQSLSELIRQRRRWINGSFHCLLYSLAQVFSYLLKNNGSILSRWRLLRSIPLSLIKIGKDWFYPSLYILLLYVLYNQTINIFVNLSWNTSPINLIFSIHLFLLILHLLTCLFDRIYYFLWYLNIMYNVIIFSIILTFWSYTGHVLLGFGFILVTIAIYSVAYLDSFLITKKIWKYIPIYLLINPICEFLLNTYSFCNIDNKSWGTKGLVTAKRNIQYKFYYVSLWLISNISIIFLALHLNFIGLTQK